MVGTAQKLKSPIRYTGLGESCRSSLKPAGDPRSRAFRPGISRRVPSQNEGMKLTKLAQQNFQSSNGLLLAPAYHKSGSAVVRTLKQALDRAECSPGQQLEQKQVGHMVGVAKSTIHDWFHGKLAGSLQNFLCVFERLTETERILILREICRPCPRLEHPRLAHDAEALIRLKASLNQPAGLTFVVGAPEPRTFLVTALGHSITRVKPTSRVCGLDIHRPDSFVPVAGVFYCQRPPNLELAQHLAAHIMAEVEVSKAELVIFNGIWSGISQFLKAIQRLAATRHLIVADDFDPAFDRLAWVGPNPVQVMAVSQIPGKQGLIHADFRSPDLFGGKR